VTFAGGLQLGGGNDGVGDAEPLTVVGRQSIAEEHELLGPLRADDPGQQIAPACGHAVHRRDDRLLTVQNRRDEPLPTAPYEAGDVTDGLLRRAAGTRRAGGLRSAQTRTGAGMVVARAREHDGANGHVGRRFVEPVAQVVPHAGRQ